MKKIKKIVWVLLLAAWAFMAVVSRAQESAPVINESELYAQAAVLMDAESGRVLYGKNADQVLAMASTTKIMTCIVALENGQGSETVEVSGYAAGMPAVKLGMRKGEKYQLEDLLYSLMLESHNDTAVAIAEHIGRKLLKESAPSAADHTLEESKQAVAAFADLMNEKAKELGCERTYFITPNGLDGEEVIISDTGDAVEKFHSTTAEELALIMSYCVLDSPKSQQFLKITQTAAHTFSSEGGRKFACYNHNAFLNMMQGAISGKTGFTNRAGYCYVGALERENRTFVVALLACGWPYNKNYKWEDTRKLMEYGVKNYFYRSFLDHGTVDQKKWLEPIPVSGGKTDEIDGQAFVDVGIEESGDEMSGLLMRAGEEIAVEYSVKDMLAAPVEQGMKVGEVRYTVNGIVYRREEIVTKETVEKIDWQWCLEQIFSRYLLLN